MPINVTVNATQSDGPWNVQLTWIIDNNRPLTGCELAEGPAQYIIGMMEGFAKSHRATMLRTVDEGNLQVRELELYILPTEAKSIAQKLREHLSEMQQKEGIVNGKEEVRMEVMD